MKHQVRRIGVLSSAKIAFFVYWALGIIMTLFYGFTLALLSFVDPGQIDPEFSKMSRFVGGLGAMVVLLLGFFLSLLYAVMGATGTALVAIAYNLLARMVGGVEVELSPAKDEPSSGATVAGENIRRRDRSGDATATEVAWTPVDTGGSSARPESAGDPDARWRPGPPARE